MIGPLLEDGRWLVASAPASGTPAQVLARQARLAVPVKAVASSWWRAEMPDGDGAADVVRLAITAAIEDAQPSPVTEDPMRRLLDAAGASALPWNSAPAGLALGVDTRGAMYSITASVIDSSACFRTPLVWRNVPEPARDVMNHFLLAANTRLRLARASWADQRIVLEVVLPVATLSGSLVEEAVRALGAGRLIVRRGCAALLDGQVARQYREFHLEKETIDENANSGCDRLERIAAGRD
jgi:hypothetical protein